MLKALTSAMAERAATVAKATAGTLEGEVVDLEVGRSVKVPRQQMASFQARTAGAHDRRSFDRLVVSYALESGQIDGMTADRLRAALTTP